MKALVKGGMTLLVVGIILLCGMVHANGQYYHNNAHDNYNHGYGMLHHDNDDHSNHW